MKKIHVTKILNEYEIVLNIGEDDGINSNTTFAVYGETDIIVDPITSEKLGEVPFIKENLQVKQLFPKLCICEVEGNGAYVRGTSLVETFRLSTSTPGHYVHEKLNIDIDDLSKEEVDNSIRLGDRVEITHSPSYENEETEEE